MKTNRLVALLFILGLTLQLQSQDRWQLIRDHLAGQHGLSGYFIMGAHGNVMVSQGHGHANRETSLPFDDQTLYSIGSITKSITATAILLLEERGKLAVTDPISYYFDHVPADKQSITIHHLLTHSAGFSGAIGDDYEAIDAPTFAARAFSLPLNFEPGKGYMYSNVGYSLLGMIIEKVSGESYGTFLQKNIFAPAGMKTAGYTNPDADYKLIAHGYTPDGNDWGTARDKLWDGNEPYWHLKANGGILVSANDMYKWYLALRNNTILSKSSISKQILPHVKEGEDNSWYGYGYVVTQAGDVVQHNGGNRIFKADFRWFPQEDMFIFSVTNDANVRLFRLNDELVDIFHSGELPSRIIWEPVPLSTFPNTAAQGTAKEFAVLLQSYSREKGEAFIAARCSERIVQRNGIPRLLDVFGRLSVDIAQEGLKAVNANPGTIQLVFPAGQPGAVLKVNLFMNHDKIDRLTAEMEGS